jgi:hypothetical protein
MNPIFHTRINHHSPLLYGPYSSSSKPEKHTALNHQLILPWRLILGLFVLLTLNSYQTVAQTGSPCVAIRWTDGDHWTGTNCGITTTGTPKGIVSCDNAAATQSNIDPNTTYNPANFTISGLSSCTDPNTLLPVTVNAPFTGQKMTWFNFDVRKHAGTYQFQTISTGSFELNWALYNVQPVASTCSTSGSNNISGNCTMLSPTPISCGIGFTGWSDQPFVVPDFNQPTNLYLAVWRRDATNSSNDDYKFTFKARYGCGEICSLFQNGPEVVACSSNGTYTVVQQLDGTSTTVTVTAPGSISIVTNPSPLTFTGSNSNPSVTTGTVTVTYPAGVNYDITFTPSGSTFYPCTPIHITGIAPCSTAPGITCPPSITVDCASLVPTPNTSMVTSTANCQGTASVSFVGDAISNQTCTNRFTVTRTYRAMDNCGNSATCTQTITVFDNTAPTINCPGNVTVQCANQVPSPASITASDNCGGTATVTVLNDAITNQTCANRYTVVRTFRATDACGNSASCTQQIFVYDDTAPGITCPNNVTVQCASDVPAANPGSVSASDNCGGTATVSLVGDVISNQTCANRYTVTRTYRAIDACGNSSTCNQLITVNDNTAPTLTCPANTTVQCANQVPTPNPSAITSSDNCSGTNTVSFVGDVISNQTCANRFVVTRTYRVDDVCGNFSTCTQTITVFDNSAPSLTCPGNTTVACASDVPVATPGSITSSDNCGGTATVTLVGDAISNQSCPNRFTLTRTYRATDVCGNSATCTQVITVFDNVPPQMDCPNDITVECANQVPTPNTSDVGTFDNCGGSMVSFVGDVISNQTCLNRYTITRTYRSTDLCGNSSTCTQLIVVYDDTAPSITCPGNVTVSCASNVPPVNTGSVTSSDNCGGGTTVSFLGDVVSNQTCANRFTVTRTYKATDACGNSATCTQVVTVYDNTPPVCATHNITVTVNQDIGFVTITPQQVDNGSSDLCGPVTLDVNPNTFVCEDEGPNIVFLTVTDQCGNTSSCSATVTVNSCNNPCITPIVCVYLEGAAANPNGLPTYSVPMRTTLNNLKVLPGQTYLDPFFGIPHYTLPGQPYNIAPWNYPGTEGAAYNSMGNPVPGTAGYPPDVTDWVLVSLRVNAEDLVPACQAAALLHSNGTVEFVQPFDCCDLSLAGSYYIVVEHRNHLIVMSDTAVQVVPGLQLSTITYSFCSTQSYINDPFGFGIYSGQKEILNGVFAMIAGNGEQVSTTNSDTDINIDDRGYWEQQNGTFGEYRIGDYNLNADTNLNDRVVWERNNGRFTSVPR